MNNRNPVRSPSEFMKARRPELFSDTIMRDEPIISRDQLEFHLDTLTTRKEEIRFEHFCRRLAERELCPNLLPQTGPTGGGDSKVDSETYPVSEMIALRWYEGEPAKAATERWAFAFSAKKKWRDKIRNDVKNIVETGRDYALIYFVTNQAVRDKTRAELEDALRSRWGVPVRILDRSWITEKVIGNRRWDVLFQTLEIADPRTQRTVTPGPLDAERSRSLEELEAQIEDPERYQNNKYQLAEDCLQTALLARGLGQPRTEIDGRFGRAERLARNDHRQLFRILYHKAWTALMWFDDFEEIARLYEVAAPLVMNEGNVWDLEKLTTLYNAGRVWEQTHQTIDWTAHGTQLRQALVTLSDDDEKPTSALWARTQLIFHEIADSQGNAQLLSETVGKLNRVLEEAQGLLDFPVEPIIATIQELGDALPDDELYEQLLENAIAVKAERVSDAEQGHMRLKAGLQQLRAGRNYTATTQLAKSQILLAQDEHKLDFLVALAGTASAYEATGLPWAARANLIFALDRTLYEYPKTGKILPHAAPILKELVWTELRTGRVPCIVPWIRWLAIINQVLTTEQDDQEEDYNHLDAVLGILILRTRFEDWRNLGQIPALLEQYGLLLSRSAALFALGHADRLEAEYGQSPDDAQEFFSQWAQQPAADELPRAPGWLIGQTTTMRSSILGCTITLTAENDTSSLLLGEAILACTESFLATTIMLEGHYAPRSNLRIRIGQSEHAEAPFSSRIDEDDCGETHISIIHSGQPAAALVRESTYKDAMVKLLAEIIAQLHIPFTTDSLKGLFAQERAQDRAFLSAQSPLAITNLLGEQPYAEEDLTNLERLELQRTEPWKPESAKPGEDVQQPSWEDRPPRAGAPDMARFRHSDLHTDSPINMPLWDKARWRGLGFIQFPDDPIPILVLAFEDFESGFKIFRGWRTHPSDANPEDLIAVTLITDIDRDHPTHYRLAIGANHEELIGRLTPGSLILSAVRMQDMTPETTENLDRFLHAYENTGRYRLMPGSITHPLHPEAKDLAFDMTQLSITPAWKIGPNSPLRAALLDIDNPMIPDDVADPPILKTRQTSKFRQIEESELDANGPKDDDSET